MRERNVLRDPVPTDADLDRELGLGVDVGGLRRQHDRLARPDEGVLELPEQERRGGRVVAELGRVLCVVASDTDDLHRPILTQ